MKFPEPTLRNWLRIHCPDVGEIKAKKGIFKVGCFSCDSTALRQTDELVLLEAKDGAKALGGQDLTETLGSIQTILD